MIAILRLQARRDRLQLTVWVGALGLLATFATTAVQTEYGDATSRTGVLRIALVTPSLLALRGVPNGASLGSTIWFQLFAFLAVVAGLLNGFLATRHGRGDEERGRRELVAATPVPRWAPLAATLLLGAAFDVVLGALLAGGLVVGGLPASGAMTAAAAFAVTGLAFLGIGLLVGELAATGRSANGITTAIVLLSYALRGAGDALGDPDLTRLTLRAAWPSWTNPIGWGEQAFAFTANRPAPLLLSLALFAVTAGGAAVIRSRRDLGASLLQEQPGRATGAATLRGPAGLMARLSWPAVAGWTTGGALFGLIIGPLTEAVRNVVATDPVGGQMMASLGHGRGEVTRLFVTAVMTVVGVLGAAAALQTTLRLHEEESSNHAEALLATPARRSAWLASGVGSGWVAALVVLAAAALTAWAGLVASGEDEAAGRSVGQAFAELPAALVFAGVAALLVAVVPRLAIPAAWSIFAIAVVLGLFGGLLRLPEAVRNASPFSVVPDVPVDDWLSTVVLTAVAMALPLLAIVALRRRDVPA